MKLEFIRLENFRQFYGTQQAEFSPADDLNVTVFHGMNGAGKTSLFSAINWCLYDAGVEEIGELISKKAISEAVDGDIITTRVSIWFVHQGTKYIAERFISVEKAGNQVKPVNKEFTLAKTKANGDTEFIDNPKGHMNAILPENVRPYFFFDGEKMDDLTRAENREVEAAVRNIMRLPALERAQAHLAEIARDYRSEVKRHGSPELEKLITQEEKLRSAREKSIARRDAVREELRLVKQQIEDLEIRLRATEATRELQKRRDDLQSLLQEHEVLEQERLERIQKVVNRCYLSLLSDCMQEAMQVIDRKREKGEIPSGMREQLVLDLLEKRVCVCGRPFSEHDNAYKALEAMLKRAASSELEDAVLRLGADIRSLSNIANSELDTLTSLSQERHRIQDGIAKLYAELDDINRELKDAPQEEIAGLERNLTKFQRNRDALNTELGRLERDIEQTDRGIEEVTRRKRDAEAKEQKLALLTKKAALAQEAADAVGLIKDQFFEQTRQEIEAATKEVFGKLAWKQEHFQDIQLDSDFRLEVIDRWGMPTRKELSAGERQILSLAFITAMARVAGEDAPLVMDTPFGRLSGNHLKAVAENLPDLTSQLILFVTDREWDEASRTQLEPRTGVQFELRFDQKTSCTDIVEKDWL